MTPNNNRNHDQNGQNFSRHPAQASVQDFTNVPLMEQSVRDGMPDVPSKLGTAQNQHQIKSAMSTEAESITRRIDIVNQYLALNLDIEHTCDTNQAPPELAHTPQLSSPSDPHADESLNTDMIRSQMMANEVYRTNFLQSLSPTQEYSTVRQAQVLEQVYQLEQEKDRLQKAADHF